MLSGVAIRFGSVGAGTLAALLAAPASLLVVAGHVKAQCQYDVTILQFPLNCGIGTVITAGLSLNENGTVVGRYQCPLSKYSQGFLWTPEGGFVGLQPPAGVIEVIPTDINDQGVICGTMIVADIGKRGFVYDHGVWTVLPPVVDMLGTWSSAAAISNDNIVVGQRSITENLNPKNAYVWSAAEGFTDLGVMQGPLSGATDVSDDGGVVVGWTGNQTGSISDGFLWQNGRVIFLGPVPGGFTSRLSAVEGNSVVAGSGRIPLDGSPVGAPRAFIWQNDKFTMLGVLAAHSWSAAGDMRSSPRQVVGSSWNVDGNPNIRHGFIWQDSLMLNLNDLLAPDLALLIQSASAIDSRGQILANGHDEDGDVVALLLTAIQPVGDLDADCRVGILDLLRLLVDWGESDSPADLDNDGVVGLPDLLILLANWG